jgi:hypothetical protein
MRSLSIFAAAAVLVLLALPAAADMALPPGFTARVYVTGEGFDPGTSRGARGIPSSSTLAVDRTGTLYLARTGRRYQGGEVEDVWPVYRVPPGGARLTPATERRYFHGPPVPNPQIAALRDGRDVFVSTFDRDRRVGVLYRLDDGRAEMVAGGTPPRGEKAALVQPEGAAFDGAGNLYVADRASGVVVKLDPSGRILDPRWLSVPRPRIVVRDETDRLWVASDGAAEAPWQRGPGEIWRVALDGTSTVMLRGPVAAGLAVGPGNTAWVADRQAAKIVVIVGEGQAVEFATFSDGDAPRTLGFAPVTPETRQAGIAGDLFVVTVSRGAWPVNEVLRISGPFEDLARRAASGGR